MPTIATSTIKDVSATDQKVLSVPIIHIKCTSNVGETVIIQLVIGIISTIDVKI